MEINWVKGGGGRRGPIKQTAEEKKLKWVGGKSKSTKCP